MGLIAMKPLGGGLLDDAALCFRFLQQFPDVVPIPGISKSEEMDEILALYKDRQPLSADQTADVERIRSELGEKFCHRCGYCQPCDQGVAITDILSFRSTAKRLPPNMAAMLSKKAIETVDNCSECGECVERCPYDLDIPVLIREIQQEYSEISA